MQKNIPHLFLPLFFCLFTCALFAQSSTKGSSGMQGSSKIEPLKPLEKPTPRAAPTPAKTQPVLPPTKPAIAQTLNYFYPGILVYRNNAWEGGDNLLNLSTNIDFYLSIIKPDSDPLKIPEDKLKLTAEVLLKNAGIVTTTLVPPGEAPLPYFQVQILIYPVSKEGYVACCEGRLFESVSLRRINLDPKNMAFQAVTWQKSSLIISPSSQINEQLQLHVEDIVKAFAERFQAFSTRKA